MREPVMETPLYTLQIKAKPCPCFSTHFQETGRDGPRHQRSLVSCECLEMKTDAQKNRETCVFSQQTDRGERLTFVEERQDDKFYETGAVQLMWRWW